MTITGECLCGQVRYEVDADPLCGPVIAIAACVENTPALPSLHGSAFQQVQSDG